MPLTPSTQEAEAGVCVWVPDNPDLTDQVLGRLGLHSDTLVSKFKPG